MGKSAASMALIHKAVAQTGEPRLPPPAGLGQAQLVVWHQAVDNLPPDWFAQEHEPLLIQYCNHVVRDAQLESALAGLDPVHDLEVFDKLTKLAALESGKITALARAMRLTHQSRLKAETASNRANASATALTYFDDLNDPEHLIAR